MSFPKLAKMLAILMVVLFVCCLLYLLVKLLIVRKNSVRYSSSQIADSDVLTQLNSIKNRLENGEAEKTQQIYPEGYYFSYVLYGFSWINVGLQTTDLGVKQKAISEAEWTLQKIEESPVRHQFGNPDYLEFGIFYRGWVNRLRGGILLVQQKNNQELDQNILTTFTQESDVLANAFRNSHGKYLQSYPGKAWPADSLPALSSFQIHDQLFETNYREQIVLPFISQLKSTVDEDGMIFHKVEYDKNSEIDEARGSSLAYILIFLPELDHEFSSQQYELFNNHFRGRLGPWYLFREYKKGINLQKNADSGPIMFGYAGTSTVVALGSAKMNNDQKVFHNLLLFNEVVGFPWKSHGKKSYFANNLMIYDEFLVWGKSVVEWK